MSPAFLAPASLRLIPAVEPQASGRCSPHASLSPLPSLAAVGAAVLLTLAPAGAATMRLPPIDRNVPDSVRCLPTSSAIGQANAARDSLLDLRECDLRSQNLDQFDLSGAILEGAVFDGSTFRDAMLSKAYAPRASFKNCDFSNAVVDRAYFDGSDMTSSDFKNAVLSDTTFEGANLTGTNWEDAYIGDFTQKAICRNETLSGETKDGEPSRVLDSKRRERKY